MTDARSSCAGRLLVAVALAVGVLVGCAAPAAPPPATPPAGPPSGGLRVMTWNVQTRDHTPAEWAPTIAAWAPDVVGLQEICADEVTALAELLRRDHGLSYEAVPGPVRPIPSEDVKPVNAALRRPCRDGAVVRFGLGVLSRLPVAAAATELLPPDNRDEQRGYQRLTLRAPDASPVTLYNTHVGLAGVASGQIRALGAAAGTEVDPTIVLGDLNVTVDDAGVLGPLSGRFAEVDPPGRLPTAGNRIDEPTAPADRKIDYIFHRGLGGTVDAAAPWVPSSDHRPLIGDLGG